MARDLVSARTIADATDTHEETIRRLWRGGRIPGYRVGRYLRFDLDEVLDALRSDRSVTDRGAAVAPDFEAV